MDAYKKALIDLEKALEEATRLVYPAMALALNDLGWSNKKIEKTCESMAAVLSDIPEDKSLIQLLDEETGIELMCENSDRHWYELTYLNEASWNEYLRKHNGRVSRAYMIQVKMAQKKWCIPMMYATVFMGLIRAFNYKHRWISQLYGNMDKYLHDVDFDVQKIDQLIRSRLGMYLKYGVDIGFEYVGSDSE